MSRTHTDKNSDSFSAGAMAIIPFKDKSYSERLEKSHHIFCQSIKTSFEFLIEKSVIVSPGALIMTQAGSIAASSLKLSLNPGDRCSHFVKSDCQLTKEMIDALNNQMEKTLEEEKKCYTERSILSSIAKCEFQVCTNLQRLSGKISNESELRYTLGNSIITLLCNFFALQAKLEEMVSPREQEYDLNSSISTKVGAATSTRSHSDYSLYSLNNDGGKTLIVLLETKMTNNDNYRHAVAQVIGYYAAMRTSTVTRPVALVLSENTMQLVLFPFQDDNEILINAVLLPECTLWGTSSILEKVIFGILMCTVDSSILGAKAIEYPFHDKIVKRSIEKCVITETEELEKVQEERDTLKKKMINDEEERDALKKQMNAMREELIRLRQQ